MYRVAPCLRHPGEQRASFPVYGRPRLRQQHPNPNLRQQRPRPLRTQVRLQVDLGRARLALDRRDGVVVARGLEVVVQGHCGEGLWGACCEPAHTQLPEARAVVVLSLCVVAHMY